jgi:effector-binding domain-containing protein/ribosome-associated toxin RatA of RatAB toxin-antitoxin module
MSGKNQMTTLIFVVAFCIVAVFVYMARYSGRLRVTQTRIIDAPICEVYSRVADFRRWSEWNPWLEHEPDVQAKLTEPTDGVGSTYAWDSEKIGAGFIEHVRLAAQESIEQKVRFKNPFRFRGRSRWQFTHHGGKTEVTWSFNGRVGFSLRAFAQTVQGTIALDYRYGLDRLARLLEPATASRYSLAYLGVRDIPASRYAYATYKGTLKGLGEAVREGFAKLRQQLVDQGLQDAGLPIAVYATTNIKLRTTVCHIGILIGDADAGQIPVRVLPSHRAFVVRLQGSYAAMEVAWYHAMQRMRIDNIQPDQRISPFERYLGDPGTAQENDYVTELHIPVRLVPSQVP